MGNSAFAKAGRRRRLVYMDNHATTPVDPRVTRAMIPYFSRHFGNAASFSHAAGRQAAQAADRARAEIAKLLNAEPAEIVFTSGATESVNLALKGAARAASSGSRHLVAAATEHKAVLDSLKRLESEGFSVTIVPVEKDGLIDLEKLRRALRPDTLLLSVMHANNEIGVIQPIDEIGKIARERGILFHCDAAQSAGKWPIDVRASRVDLLSLSAHKIYGPKGVGALYVRKSEPRVRLLPLLDGGGQETGFRSGTLNVPGAVGFGEACRIARKQMRREAARIGAMRDRLQEGLQRLGGVTVNGHAKRRLSNNLNISFEGVRSEELMKRLPRLAVSAGSACISSSPEPSYVLKAIGVEEQLRRGTLRFGLGRFNTQKEVDFVVKYVAYAVTSLRKKRRR